MPSYRESIYSRLPVFAQNLAISVEGWRLARRRFGGEFRRNLSTVEAVARKSADEIAAIQLQRLQTFLHHAYDQTAHYREAFDNAGVHPSDLRDVSDLHQFPVLEKDVLRSRTSTLLARSLADGPLFKSFTSGTTGTPITVAYTTEDIQMRFAYLYRMLGRFGIGPSDRQVRLSGRTLFHGAEKNGIFWRYNAARHQLFMSTYHMLPANLDRYIEKLRTFGPAMIDGYPSAIFLLARQINARGLQGSVCPKLIMTTAETLEDFQRTEMEQAFPGAQIANQYASSEGAPFVTQDEFGDLVINTDTGVIEVEDWGTDGGMLVTSFTTHAYPLIRYRIGDRITLDPGKIARSMAMPVAKAIVGRQEDLIVSPDRGPIGRLDPVFKKMPSTIVESQIVQTAADAVVVRVVPDAAAGYDSGQMDGVVMELKDRLGAMQITVNECTTLQRSANGKLRAVVGLPMRDLAKPED